MFPFYNLCFVVISNYNVLYYPNYPELESSVSPCVTENPFTNMFLGESISFQSYSRGLINDLSPSIAAEMPGLIFSTVTSMASPVSVNLSQEVQDRIEHTNNKALC